MKRLLPAISLALSASTHATIIDTFDDVIPTNIPAFSQAVIPYPDALGGKRRIQVMKSGMLSAEVDIAGGGFHQSAGVGTRSRSVTIWDTAVPVDLTDFGLAERLLFNVLSIDQGNVEARFFVQDDDGNTGFTLFDQLVVGAQQFLFSDMPLVDWEAVTRIVMILDGGPATDVSIDLLRTQSIPTPATMALFAIGALGGIGALRCQHSKK